MVLCFKKTYQSMAIKKHKVSWKWKVVEAILLPEIEKTATAETLKIRMLDYYDYPNEGVKGVNKFKECT